jgi:hypothetical protein
MPRQPYLRIRIIVSRGETAPCLFGDCNLPSENPCHFPMSISLATDSA